MLNCLGQAVFTYCYNDT